MSDDAAKFPKYARCLWEPAEHYALYGGRGGGKSWSVARYLLIEAARKSLRIGCAREVQKTIADSVKALLDDQIKELGLRDYFDSTKTEIVGKRNESRFVFFGLWRDPEGLKSLEGLDKLWNEEARQLSQRSIDVIIPTVRKSGSSIIWTWNPEFDHDPVDVLFRGPMGPPPRSIVKRVGWEDNPYLSAKALGEKDTLYKRRPRAARHIWGGEYAEEIEGAYFASELDECRRDGRVRVLSESKSFELRAYWDLGRRDSTAVIVCQFVGERINILDYCEGRNQPPSYYFDWLRDNGYKRALNTLPHDGDHIHPDNPISMSYSDQMRQAGFKVTTRKGDGSGEIRAARKRIDVAKDLFSRIYFNEGPTRALLKALGNYHEKIHEQTRAGLGPDHDWSSHAADAFGLMAVDYEPPRKSIKIVVPNYGVV